MDDPNFCSSDVEFDPPPPNPFRDAGKASIEAMLDHAFEDRIASKKQAKQLTFVKGSPKTQYQHALWWNRWTEFRANTMRDHGSGPPTAEDLERFFTTIASRVRPVKNQVPSFAWLKGGVTFTIMNCIFHHADFTLSPHERLRLSTNLNALLEQGKLTQDPTLERAWAGAVVVRKLVAGLLDQAFKQGTMTWDLTIAKCLSIVFVAALGSRAGDVTKTRLDRHSLPYLAYRDVVIRIKGTTIDDLEAVVTIRNEKGDKLDPKKKRTVLLKALPESSDSFLCPIKLLLVLALRLGHVPETSVDDLLRSTSQRKSKTVMWSYPERPVFAAFLTAGAGMDVDKPAGYHQLTKIVSEASRAAGLLQSLHAHDLRRGAARDTANLSGKLKGNGVADDTTSTVLGHSANPMSRILTAHYVGAHHDDVWTKRVESDFIDSIHDMPEAETPYQRKLQGFGSREITEVCRAEGLDEHNKSARGEAGKRLEKRRRADWVDEESRKRHSPASPVESPDECSDGQPNECSDGQMIDAEDFPLDPQLAQLSEGLCNAMVGANGGAEQPNVEMLIQDDLQQAEHDHTLPPTAKAWETSDTLSFVQLFSTLNVTCNQGLQQGGKDERSVFLHQRIVDRLSGNSRDHWTAFLYACKNQIHGCPYVNGHRTQIGIHEITCGITSNEVSDAMQAKEAAKTFKCTEDPGRCQKSYDTNGKLNKHVKEMHGGWPKPCPKGCEGSFNTRNELNRHMESHSPFTPTKCLVPLCTSTTVFERAKTYRDHIKKVHKITGKEVVDQYMPYTKKDKFEPTQCRVAGCKSPTTFKQPYQYKKHLRNTHEMDDSQIELMGCPVDGRAA